MSRFIGRALAAAVLLALGLSAPASAQEVGAGTEKLLKDTKLDYRKAKEGVFRVVLETKAGTSIIVVEEKKMPWKDSKDNDVTYAYVWCEILTTPTDFTPNATLLARLADINDRIRFGSIGMTKNQDGSTSFFRNGQLFVRNTDGEQLADLIIISHNEKFAVQKELKRIIEEGK